MSDPSEITAKPGGIEAWHFVQDDGTTERLKEPHAVGVPYHVEAPLKLCAQGLHGSRKALDALRYASGPVCQRTWHTGEILEGDDKLCSEDRTVRWQFDAMRVLHDFALEVAEEALRKAAVTDDRCWTALSVKRRWLDGQATSQELAASREASREASWAASRAAWEASRNAALVADWEASRDRFNARPERLLEGAHEERDE